MTRRGAKAEVGRGAAMHLVSYALIGACGFAFTVGVSRRLGYGEFGAYSEALGTMIFTALVCRLGLDVAGLHHVARASAAGESALAAGYARASFALSAGVGVVGALVALAVSAPLADALGVPVALLRILLLGVPFQNAIYVAASVLRGAHRPVSSFVPLVASPFLSLAGAGVLLVVFHAGILAVAWATLGAMALAALAGTASVLRAVPGPAARPPLASFGKLAGSNYLVQLCNYAIAWAPLFVLGLRASPSDVGLFRAAYQTALLLTLVVEGLSSLYAPMTSRLLRQGDAQQLAELTRGAARVAFLLTGTAAVALFVAPGLALALFGKNIGPAVLPFTILVAAQAFSALFGPSAWLLVTGEKNVAAVLALVPAVALVFAVSWWLVPVWGIVGVTLGAAVGIAARSLGQYGAVRRELRVDALSAKLAAGALLAAALALAGRLVTAWVPAAVAGLVAALAFLVAGSALVLTRDDRDAALELTSLRGLLARPMRDEEVLDVDVGP